MGDKTLAFAIAIIMAMSVVLWHFRDKSLELERRLAQANQTIELLKQTQKAADDALAEANRLKEISDAENRRQRAIMEEALRNAASWSDTAIPEPVRSMYRQDAADHTVHATEGAAAAGDLPLHK